MMYTWLCLIITSPGSGQGYQVLTFGLYADQLVRRVDHKHRSLAEYFEQEIAKPFGKYTEIYDHYTIKTML